MESKAFMDEAARLAMEGLKNGEGGPFGAVIVRGGEIIGRGWNQTFKLMDPSAHAEVQAIRNTCKELKTLELAGAVMYCTGEPCPMCMSAIYWTMLDGVYFANTKEQGALCGFDDAKLYKELKVSWKERALSMVHFPNEAALEVFKCWEEMKAEAIGRGETI
jgi:tRNA(Arg) A34 adenosine deaminase TadA